MSKKTPSATLYDSLFNNNLIGISIAEKFNLIKVNNAFCKMLGYTNDEFMKKGILEITVQDSNDESIELIEKLVAKEIENFTVLKKYFHKSGEIIYAETNVSGVYDDDNYLMSIAMHQNVTDKVFYNRELEISEALFRGLFESSPLGITIGAIKNGNLKNVNPGFCKITGYNQEELDSISVKKITHPTDRNKHIKLFEKLKKSEVDSFDLEKRYVSKSGKTIWANTTVSTIRNQLGELISDFAIIEDITERKKYEEKLKRTNRTLKKINEELDHFVYRTSHDLKAPLSSILGLINLARLDKEADPYHMFDTIESQIHKLGFFIKDIIDYSRISRLENTCSKIDFEALISSALKDNEFINGYKKVKKSIDIIGDCDFSTDNNKLKIIFNNIISNAIKYSDLDKTKCFINIKIIKTSQNALIEIVDNGVGIKKDRIPKLFNMFYRATDTGEGSGLGLFIIKEALNSINGEINIQSEYELGTTINISIPNKA